VLLTGPFGGLTDDVREFLRCLAIDGLAPSPLLPSPQPLPTNPTAWPAQDHGPGRLGRCVAPCW
jgi:hypothetical protein